jgi:hypothetical protein
MSAESALLVRKYQVGRYSVTLSCPRPMRGTVTMMTCEWEPSAPEFLTRPEQRAYDAARGDFMTALLDAAGLVGDELEVD